ncbi:hypothetical protein [uncultured Rikenella sp.]|uniref:hypothetical protein n=1 Tax=uncultured Rikenella sp. TaxID=368003 RepID=UPI0025EB9FCF|nr:hypothetical protein [uncultured Rikenella sp.]
MYKYFTLPAENRGFEAMKPEKFHPSAALKKDMTKNQRRKDHPKTRPVAKNTPFTNL